MVNDQTEYTSKSEENTAQIARELATNITGPALICLYGDLGAGKSLFARRFIQHLIQADIEVPSPTFTLVQNYDCDQGFIYHYDLYRLEDPEEIYELDWESALSDAITIVEWPTRLGALLPARRIDVKITPINQTTRRIEIDDRR